jgi:outer membrane protein assembly factor BamB
VVITLIIFFSVQVLQTSLGLAQTDWPSFNGDDRNSCLTRLKGNMDLKRPKLKWAREIPDLWTGFTSSSQGGFLAFTPLPKDEVVLLNPTTGEVEARLPAPERLTPKAQGTGEGVPLFGDVTGDGTAELFATIDSYGVVAWNLAEKKPLWSRPIAPQGTTGDLNAVLGDIDGDGREELIVMSTRGLRMLECYDARTGEELWVYTDRDFPCKEGWDCSNGWDYDWLQGTISQNFPVWFAKDKDEKPTRLLFQHQTADLQGVRGVDLICIETHPSIKAMTFWNNPPGPYSNIPLLATSHISPGGDPEPGKYQLDFLSPNRVSVNGGRPKPIVADGGSTPHEDIIKGLRLYFAKETKAGDRAIIEVHPSPRRVWKKTFYTGLCFAHFLLEDFNNDGEEEIAFGTIEKYYLVDKDGNLLWQYDTGIPARQGGKNVPYEDVVWGGAFADVDNDGLKEIVFDAFDTLVCLRGDTGEEKWRFKVPRGDLSLWAYAGLTNFLRVYPLIADLDGNGDLEIVTADSENVYALNKEGRPVMKYQFARYYLVDNALFTPDGKQLDVPFTSKRFIFADIDGDGKGELVGSIRLRDRERNLHYHRVFCLE